MDSSGLGYLDSEYESTLSNVTTPPNSPILGNAVFIVSPYLNRQKSLAALVAKLNAATANVNFQERITELREISLKKALEFQEAQKRLEKEREDKLAEKNGGKIKPAEEIIVQNEWSSSSSEDSDWGTSSNSKNSSKELPDSGKNSDSW